MATLDPEIYGRSLLARVSEAVVVEKVSVTIGTWVPQRKMCHHNVSYFCEQKPRYSPVRGWFYFELPGMSYAKFLSHSVVCSPDGTFYDITPWEATEHYPFLPSNLSEDEYADFVEEQGCNELNPLKSQ